MTGDSNVLTNCHHSSTTTSGGSNTSLSRRTRGERTKRRERYLTAQRKHEYVNGGTGANGTVAQHINNSCCRKCGQRLAATVNNASTIVRRHTTSITSELSNSNRSEVKPRDHLYKILVIGDLGTGKTSIIKRYVHQFFTQHYRATIGVDFALKVLHLEADTLVRLQLWDIAGQERFGNMTRVYYKEAVGTFIVFDVTRANTFESVANWKDDLDSKVRLPNGDSIPCVLLANKCDQQKEGIVNNQAKMDRFCSEKGFLSWFETSAKENINIEEAASALVKEIMKNEETITNAANKDKEQFSLAAKADEQNQTKSCSC